MFDDILSAIEVQASSQRPNQLKLHNWQPPKIHIADTGNVVKYEVVKKRNGPPPPPRSAGDLVVNSKSSRANLRKQLYAIGEDAWQNSYFITLTYADSNYLPDNATIKYQLKLFNQRAKRNFPHIGYIWRIEFQDRKSGINFEDYVAHFHLLIFGAESEEQATALAELWQLGRVDTRKINNYKKAIAYVNKYMNKAQATSLPYYPGRTWGFVNKKLFHTTFFSTVTSVEVSLELGAKYGRALKRYQQAKNNYFAKKRNQYLASIGKAQTAKAYNMNGTHITYGYTVYGLSGKTAKALLVTLFEDKRPKFFALSPRLQEAYLNKFGDNAVAYAQARFEGKSVTQATIQAVK